MAWQAQNKLHVYRAGDGLFGILQLGKDPEIVTAQGDHVQGKRECLAKEQTASMECRKSASPWLLTITNFQTQHLLILC